MPDEPVTMIAPQFKITLTADQVLELGRLSVIWGQIDHFLLQSATLLLTHDLAAGVMLMGDLTTGPLVNLLNKARHRIQQPEIRELAKQFCEDMGPLIKKRNHIMHGIWGAYSPGKSPTKSKPACLHVKDPNNPIFPEELTKLANDAAVQTYAISKIWHHLSGLEPPKGKQPIFYFGPHTLQPPKGTQLIQIAQPPKGYQR